MRAMSDPSLMRPKRPRCPTLCLTLLVAGCAPGSPGGDALAEGDDATLFEGARLIIGDDTPAIENAALLVRGRTILGVGRAGELVAPAGARRVDLTGKTLMPAIVDPHSHVGYYDEILDTEIQDDFREERILDHLDRFAYTGHALTYSLGSDLPTFIDARYSDDPTSFVDLRERSKGDDFTGARYLTVGRGLAWPGTGNPRSTSFYPTVSPWLAEAAVRELAAQRVELVKLWIEDRWGFIDPRSEEPAYMPAPIYGAAIREAHRLGLRTIAHVKTVHDWKGVLEAGVDAITHTVEDAPVDEELLGLIRARPGFVNISVLTSQMDGGSATRAPGERPEWLSDPLLGALKCPAFLDEWGLAFERMAPAPGDGGLWAQNTRRVREAGATVLVGSHDAGGRRALGWGSHMEMEAFVNWLGFTPHEAIRAATSATAEFVGVADELGTLEVGKSSDFIVLDANPLDDIRNTRRISEVWLRGRRVDREAMSARWAAACRAAGRLWARRRSPRLPPVSEPTPARSARGAATAPLTSGPVAPGPRGACPRTKIRSARRSCSRQLHPGRSRISGRPGEPDSADATCSGGGCAERDPEARALSVFGASSPCRRPPTGAWGCRTAAPLRSESRRRGRRPNTRVRLPGRSSSTSSPPGCALPRGAHAALRRPG